MNIYHPFRARRFYGTEPFLSLVRETEEVQARTIAEGRPGAGLIFVTDAVFDHFGDELAKVALPSVLDNAWEEGQSIESVVRSFLSGGRAIFDVSHLVEMFRHTSVDEIAVADIELPFEAFYLHFGTAALPSPIPGCRASTIMSATDNQDGRF
jgi:hypothetical protein